MNLAVSVASMLISLAAARRTVASSFYSSSVVFARAACSSGSQLKGRLETQCEDRLKKLPIGAFNDSRARF